MPVAAERPRWSGVPAAACSACAGGAGEAYSCQPNHPCTNSPGASPGTRDSINWRRRRRAFTSAERDRRQVALAVLHPAAHGGIEGDVEVLHQRLAVADLRQRLVVELEVGFLHHADRPARETPLTVAGRAHGDPPVRARRTLPRASDAPSYTRRPPNRNPHCAVNDSTSVADPSLLRVLPAEDREGRRGAVPHAGPSWRRWRRTSCRSPARWNKTRRPLTFGLVARIKRELGIEAMAPLVTVDTRGDEVRGDVLETLRRDGVEN